MSFQTRKTFVHFQNTKKDIWYNQRAFGQNSREQGNYHELLRISLKYLHLHSEDDKMTKGKMEPD